MHLVDHACPRKGDLRRSSCPSRLVYACVHAPCSARGYTLHVLLSRRYLSDVARMLHETQQRDLTDPLADVAT